jgi:lysozyme family protein
MGDFKLASTITDHNEGGFANDPHDRGGITWAGIAHNFWGLWKGWPIVLAVAAKYGNGITEAQRIEITKELRQNATLKLLTDGFYLANFWNVNMLSQFPDQFVANNVYDSGVNQGTGEAAHLLQNSVNDCLGSGTIVSDGGVGPKTIAAVVRCNQEQLFNFMNANRLARYKESPDWHIYGETWTARLIKYGI